MGMEIDLNTTLQQTKKTDQLVDEQLGREAETNEVAINFLSKTIPTRSGRVIALSNRTLSYY